MSIFHPVPSMPQPDKGSSAKQDTSVGSGSRPTKSKFPIESSAPRDPHGLDGRNRTPNKPL